MQAVDAQVDGCAFAGLDDLVLDLAAYLGHDLLDAGGVDAAVGHQLVQGQTGNLAAHRVKARQDDGLGGVVDDDLDACGSLQGAYVASLTADNAAFDLVVVDVEHGDGILNGRLGGYALNGLDDDALGLLVGGELSIVHDVVDVASCSCLGFVSEALDQLLLSFIGTETAHVLKGVAYGLLQAVNLLLAVVKHLALKVNIGLEVVQLVAFALHLALLLVELHLALLELGLG